MSLLGSVGRYSDSSADNYTDSSALASYDVAFSSRSFLRASWDYIRGHDARGSTDRGLPHQPGQVLRLHARPDVCLRGAGRAGAHGGLRAAAPQGATSTIARFTEGSDRNTTDYGGAFYWRVMPKTQLIAEARGTDLDYLLSTSPLSGKETRYYVRRHLGGHGSHQRHRQDRPAPRRTSIPTCPTSRARAGKAMITWMPRSYSKFDLYSSRQPIESTGWADFILSDASGIVWTHGWNSVFSTEASARYQKDRYQELRPHRRHHGAGPEGQLQVPPLADAGRGIPAHEPRLQHRRLRLREESLAGLGHAVDVAPA